MATSKVEALDKEAEKLRALNLKMKETQSALAAAEKRAAAAEADEQRQSAELAAHVRSLEACQAELVACSEARESLAGAHEELVSVHAQTAVQLQDVTAQQAVLEKLCDDMHVQIKDLEAAKGALVAQVDTLEGAAVAQDKVVQGLKEQVKGKEEAMAAKDKSLAIVQADLEEAEKQVDIVTQKLESSKGEMMRLQRVEAGNGDLQECITSLRAERQEAQDQLVDAKFEVFRYRYRYRYRYRLGR